MPRLILNITFAVLMALLLGVIVPGHQSHSVAELHSEQAGHGHESGEGQLPGDRHHDGSGCAICLFAADISVPLDAQPALSAHEFSVIRALPPTYELVSAAPIPVFYGRAPPAV